MKNFMNTNYLIGKNEDIHIINKDEVDELVDFQKEIINDMHNKEWFVPLTKEEFLAPILGKDNAYFFTHNEKNIGLLVLTCNIPDVLKEYQLPSDNYMLIDSIMVKDEYRGYGLQQQMLEFAYDRAIKLGMDGLVATIHPDNKYSLDNFVKQNYELLHVLTIHGGWRNIMIKKQNKTILTREI